MHFVKFKDSDRQIPVQKIVCVGRNYAEHAKELGNEVPEFPIIFLKPPSNLIYDNDPVVYPDYSQELHHEVELVLLIGKKVSKADITEAESAIEGYAVGLDMTLRDLQNNFRKEGSPWTLAKCFDTAAVISDFIPKNAAPHILSETISLSVNGKVRQQSKLDNMIFKPADIVSYISRRMFLEEGDLIYTGTPAGVSSLQRGDKLAASLGNFCSLNNEII